jgi:hypothetical protein
VSAAHVREKLLNEILKDRGVRVQVEVALCGPKICHRQSPVKWVSYAAWIAYRLASLWYNASINISVLRKNKLTYLH